MENYKLDTTVVRAVYCDTDNTNVWALKRKMFNQWLQELKADVWDEAVQTQLDTQSGVRGITIAIAPNPYR